MKIVPFKLEEGGQVDVAAVVGLIRSTRDKVEPGRWKTAFGARGHIDTWLKEPKTGILIARGIGERIEGVLVMRGEAPTLKIVHIGAKPMKEGIGTLLMNSIVALATKKGMTEIRATMLDQDPALEAFFVRKNGFKRVGEVREELGAKVVDVVKTLAPAAPAS